MFTLPMDEKAKTKLVICIDEIENFLRKKGLASIDMKRDYYIKVRGKWYKVTLEQYLQHNPNPGLFLNEADRLQWLKDQSN